MKAKTTNTKKMNEAKQPSAESQQTPPAEDTRPQNIGDAFSMWLDDTFDTFTKVGKTVSSVTSKTIDAAISTLEKKQRTAPVSCIRLLIKMAEARAKQSVKDGSERDYEITQDVISLLNSCIAKWKLLLPLKEREDA